MSNSNLDDLLLQAAGRTGSNQPRPNNQRWKQQQRGRKGSSYSGGSGSDDDDSSDAAPTYWRKKPPPSGSQVPLKKRHQPEKGKRGGAWREGDDDDDDDEDGRRSGDDSDSAPSVGSDLYKDEDHKEELEKLEKMSVLDKEKILAERRARIEDYKLKQMARALSSSKMDKVATLKDSSPPPPPSRVRSSTRTDRWSTTKIALDELQAKRMSKQDPEAYRNRFKDLLPQSGSLTRRRGRTRKNMLLEPPGAMTSCDALADAVQPQSQSLTSADATSPCLAGQAFSVSASSATHAATSEATNPEQAIDVDEEDGGDGEPPSKQPKKTTSEIWQYFEKYWVVAEENGKPVKQLWAKCKFQGCKNKTSKGKAESSRGTTAFWTHLKHYHNIVKGQQQLKSEKDHEKGMIVVQPYKYDQEASLRKLYIAIIMHEYPFNIVEHEYFLDFIKSLRPNFPIKSRVTVRKEIMELYLQEKDKLYEYFKTLDCRFSATMDMWTSNQNKGYMCVTVYWVDDDWQIQKRIINFFHVPGRHTGENISLTLSSCMLKWFIEKKMFSLTLDNAAANEVAVKDIILELKKHSPLICDGLFFHVRCANHILNLVAKDGMSVIASSIQNIRAFVLAVKGSPLQWEEFQKCATECSLDTKVGLSLDVANRWNSTYTMLRDALYYRAAFERLVSYERRRYEKIAPSSAEWDMAKSLLPCLRKFFDLTELFSGTLYPTANLFFRGFCEIKLLLTNWCHSSDPIISNMANTMVLKFDKYWKKSNIALAVATVLDPRFKRKIVEFYLRKMYPYSYQAELDKFNDIIRMMYHCYASNKPSTSAAAPSSLSAVDINMDNVDDELDSFLFDTYDHDGIETNDLEKYLADPRLKVAKANQHTFDILAWWKGHKDEYPVMWQLARDVLAMQVSTVASESAFSAGGRVLDPYRSRLDPSMVEALVCTKDWIAGARKGSRNVPSMVSDLEVLEAIASHLVLEDEDLIDDDEDGPEVQL